MDQPLAHQQRNQAQSDYPDSTTIRWFNLLSLRHGSHRIFLSGKNQLHTNHKLQIIAQCVENAGSRLIPIVTV